MKRFLAIILSALLLFSLCACEKDTETTAGSDPAQNNGEVKPPVVPGTSSSTQSQPEMPITITYDETTKTILVTGSGVIKDYGSPSMRSHDQYETEAVRIVIEEGCTGIGKNAFYGFEKVTEVVLPASLTYIGDYAFKNCDALPAVVLPEKLVSLGSGCFDSCDALTDVTIHENIRSLPTTVFSHCPLNFTVKDGVQYIGNSGNPYVVAMGNENSDSQSYSIADTTVMVGPFAFSDSKNLTEITIPASVKVLEMSAFKSCHQLTTVNLPVGLEKIGSECFKYDGELVTVNLPDTLTHIGMNAFDECSQLSRITLPRSLVEIGNTAFRWTSIEEMDYLGTVAEWEKITKQDSGTNATIHCTDGDVTF